jgi:hypothetical protein
MQTTIHRPIALAIAALWSLPAFAGDLPPPTVYVAPGGVYIGSAQVYVGPGNGNGNGQAPYAVPGPAYVPGPSYVPGYGPPAPAYAPEAYGPEYGVPGGAYAPGPGYGPPPLSAYGARPAARVRTYVSPYPTEYYPTEYAPRPPVGVPYNGGRRCVAAYGRVICD